MCSTTAGGSVCIRYSQQQTIFQPCRRSCCCCFSLLSLACLYFIRIHPMENNHGSSFCYRIPQTLFNGFEICIHHKRICCDLYGERFTLPLDRKRALYYSHSRNASSSARVHSCRCSLWFFDRYVIKNMCERVPMIGLPRLRAPNEIANLIQCKLVLCVGYM